MKDFLKHAYLSNPAIDMALDDAFRRAQSGGTGTIYVGVDRGKDDHSVRTTMRKFIDGTLTIESIDILERPRKGKSRLSEALREREAHRLQDTMDKIAAEALGLRSCPTEQTVLNVGQFRKDMQVFLQAARRVGVVFRVSTYHTGSIIEKRSENDGSTIYMNFEQARAVHQRWPLRLIKILSEHSAEFAPGVPNEYLPASLPLPPYPLSRADDDVSPVSE